MSIAQPADKIHATRTVRRWMSVDEWIKKYDEQRDPHGHYGSPGRDPQNVITKVEKAA